MQEREKPSEVGKGTYRLKGMRLGVGCAGESKGQGWDNCNEQQKRSHQTYELSPQCVNFTYPDSCNLR